MTVNKMGATALGDFIEPLLSVYFAYIPWMLFAVGLSFIFVGALTAHKHRRVMVIGLWLAVVSALWIMLRILYPAA
jgi:uncharacterized membrane protein